MWTRSRYTFLFMRLGVCWDVPLLEKVRFAILKSIKTMGDTWRKSGRRLRLETWVWSKLRGVVKEQLSFVLISSCIRTNSWGIFGTSIVELATVLSAMVLFFGPPAANLSFVVGRKLEMELDRLATYFLFLFFSPLVDAIKQPPTLFSETLVDLKLVFYL